MSYGTQKPNFGPAYASSAVEGTRIDDIASPPVNPSNERQLILMLRIALDMLERGIND